MSVVALALLLAAAPPDARDTLRLPALQDAAVRRDPRSGEYALQEAATRLRLRNFATERFPQLTAGAQATRQSEVPAIPVNVPGVVVPIPPKSHYEATLDVNQTLYDGGVPSRRGDVEEAQLAVERAQLEATLYPLRTEVSGAFFNAFLLQERMAEIGTLIEDLEARLRLLRAQVREGAALPGDTAAVLAEALSAGEDLRAAAADRRAALAVLTELTGRPVTEDDVLALPDLSAQVARARTAEGPTPAALRAHPQNAVYRAQRERLAQEVRLSRAQERPQLSAFGQLAYGRPGLAQFEKELHEYWLVGIRLRWTPWSWGVPGREREVLELRRQMVDAEQEAFADELTRQVQDDLQTMDRLEATLATDERIVVLREQVERQARAQLTERVITPSEYVDVRTDLQQARLARERHRVELAQARARYLTTLGLGLR